MTGSKINAAIFIISETLHAKVIHGKIAFALSC
jgi:hypothetical protein